MIIFRYNLLRADGSFVLNAPALFTVTGTTSPYIFGATGYFHTTAVTTSSNLDDVVAIEVFLFFSLLLFFKWHYSIKICYQIYSIQAFAQQFGITRDLAPGNTVTAANKFPVLEIALFNAVSGKQFTYWGISSSYQIPLFDGDVRFKYWTNPSNTADSAKLYLFCVCLVEFRP